MKFSKLSQIVLVSTIGLAAASLLTSCEIVTIDYLFVASSTGSGTGGSNGQIQTFDADSETGALRPGAQSIPSGGINPVSMALTSDYANLYVANQGTAGTPGPVVHLSISSGGALTQKDSVTPSTPAVALAVNKADTYLYVISGTSSATVTAYSLSSGTIGTPASQNALTVPGYPGDIILPTAVTVLANNNVVYVTAYDQSSYNPGGVTTCTFNCANPGWVFGFTVGTGGALTPVPGSPWKAGVKPAGIASDPTSRFVYVTDFASNELIGYTVQSGSVLDFMIDGPFKTGNEPIAVTVDPRGLYIYVANSLDSTVSAYDISLSTGDASAAVNVTGNSSNTTDTQPVAILVDASLGRFVYTADHLGNSVSGFKINVNTGAMNNATPASPYPTGYQPTALASVPHGNHSTQSVTP
jgi:6-phosphogluconolactonase